MAPNRTTSADDFAGWPDDDLLRRARAQDDMQAANALILRYWDRIGERIDRLASKAGLQEADQDDAEQWVFVALRRAVSRFDLRRLGLPWPGGLWPWLDKVVRRSFSTFWLRLRFRAWHDQRQQAAAGAPAAPLPGQAPDWLSDSPAWKDEPSRAAQEAEARAGLGATVAALRPDEHFIVEGLLAGQSVADLARQLGRLPCPVWREKVRIMAFLRTSLRQHRD